MIEEDISKEKNRLKFLEKIHREANPNGQQAWKKCSNSLLGREI